MCLGFAVSGGKRLSTIPDVPTVAEFGELQPPNLWLGLFAPAETPQAVLDMLSKNLASVAQDPAIITQLEKAGLTADFAGPAGMHQRMADGIQIVSKIGSSLSAKSNLSAKK